jgi:hypothetical protein
MRGAILSCAVLKTGKTLAILPFGPYASSIRYTVVRHQASRAASSQKYAATLIPVPAPLPYAKRQHAIVDPMARENSVADKIASRAVAAIA